MSDTVLVTGATGYIALHVVQQLLDGGYKVRATVRNPDDAEKTKALRDLAANAPERLDVVKGDLLDAECWPNHVTGCAYVMHTASPFPMVNPKNADDVIRPAVDGTLNVLRACNGKVKRVVLTSSIAAIVGGHDAPPNGCTFNEDVWSQPNDDSTVYHTKKYCREIHGTIID